MTGRRRTPPRFRWDATQYARFGRERSRPFHDLLARIPKGGVRRIADLGCGTGDLTRLLLERWPGAEVWGVDSSRDMLDQAQASPAPPSLHFVLHDLLDWRPPDPLDLIVSSAVLQWLPDHARVLERFARHLDGSGLMAIQIPNNRGEKAYRALNALLAEPKWAARLADAGPLPGVEAPRFYDERLAALGFHVELWETIYHHRFGASGEIVEWLKGTTLRPILSVLSERDAFDFLASLSSRIRSCYTADSRGVIFPFRRMFFVATRSGAPAVIAARRDPSP